MTANLTSLSFPLLNRPYHKVQGARGTALTIYDCPANTFVAGFIGSPAMNLLPGQISNGAFEAPHTIVKGLRSDTAGPVTLGFRAEDAHVTQERGAIQAPIYSVELLGDVTMVSVRCGDCLISVRAGKEFRANIGDEVRIDIPPAACHLFDSATGQRLDAPVTNIFASINHKKGT